MNLTDQIAVVRRIQRDLLFEANRFENDGKYVQASDCQDKVDALKEVEASLEHLEDFRKASATIVYEMREALASLPLSFQDKGKTDGR